MLNTFTDNAGDTWSVSLDVPAIRRIKEQTGLLLTKMFFDADVLNDLKQDPCAAADLIYSVVFDEAAARNLPKVDFEKRLDGDVIRVAVDLITEHALVFLQDPEHRRGVKELMAKQKEIQQQAVDRQLERINQLTSADLTDEARTNSPRNFTDGASSFPVLQAAPSKDGLTGN